MLFLFYHQLISQEIACFSMSRSTFAILDTLPVWTQVTTEIQRELWSSCNRGEKSTDVLMNILSVHSFYTL
jgi:hypothetical protein